MARFIGLFDTALDYNLQFTVTHTHTLLSTVTSSLAVAWERLLKADVPLPPVPCHRCQLPTSQGSTSKGGSTLNR
jgi:hypothetical protein